MNDNRADLRFLEKTLFICPTYNPGAAFIEWQDAYKRQKYKPGHALIVDSSSQDGSVERIDPSLFKVKVIPGDEFNHGGTRQASLTGYEDCEFVIFITQDAMLASEESLLNLLSRFDDPAVAAVCGRQLPRAGAGPIETHARLYNYPSRSDERTLADAERYGLKAAFLSNSFSAYRISCLSEIGGFPENVIFGEDMFVATKLLLKGYKISYTAEACVYHSHSYTLWQEMARYFDMGVFHAREPWIRQSLGGAEGAGLKFVSSELNYLFKRAFWRIPESLARTALRYLGFRLGLLESELPDKLKGVLAMNKGYFSS